MKKIGIFLVALILLVYVTTPFTGDQRTFFAAAHQASLLNIGFPNNVFQAWELKLIGNRLVFYGFYKIVTQVISFDNKKFFELGSKIAYALSIIVILKIVLLAIKRKVGSFESFWWALIFLLFFFSVSGRMSMQSEELTVLLVVLGTVLGISKEKFFQFASGALLALGVFTKGVTVFMIIQMWILLWLWHPKTKKVRRIIASTLFFSLIYSLIVLTIFPKEIQNVYELLLYKAVYAQGRNWLLFFKRLFISWLGWSSRLPVMMVANLFFAVGLIKWIVEKEFKNIIITFLLTLFGILAITLQTRNFPYDVYYHIAPVAYVSYLLIKDQVGNSEIPLGLYLGVWLFTLTLTIIFGGSYPRLVEYTIVWLFIITGLYLLNRQESEMVLNQTAKLLFFSIVLGWSMGLINNNFRAEKFSQRKKYIQTFTEIKKVVRADKILYLASGDAAYFLGTVSYCEQMEPHAIQRREKIASIRPLIFREMLECTKNYNGKYIILEPTWFDLSYLPDLKNKIDNEYSLLRKDSVGDSRFSVLRSTTK